MNTKDLAALAREQELLSKEVILTDDLPIATSIVTGVDVAYSDNHAVGCAVVSDIETHEILDTVMHIGNVDSEYIPGFFHLREGPIILEVLTQVDTPGTVLVDGNGILHPRRFGLASYVGLKMNLRTIGVAKRLLLGNVDSRSADHADIIHQDKVVGRALWIGSRKPIYVSIGHKISLDSAVKVVWDSCVNDYPEVLRRADLISKAELKKLVN